MSLTRSDTSPDSGKRLEAGVVRDVPVSLDQLVEFTRRLGRPANDYVILAEGNTSQRLDDGTFYVKASGASLGMISSDDFVRLRLEPLLDLVASGRAASALEVRDRFHDAVVEPPLFREPSIETFLHVVAIARCGGRFVAHTHPTAVNALLCSDVGDERLLEPLFPDEVVVCGPAPLLVPYADPGVALGAGLLRELDCYLQEHGSPPRLILLRNHGIVAIGETPEQVEAITAMAVKAARIRLGASAVGAPRPLAPNEVERLVGREDEQVRTEAIFAASRGSTQDRGPA